MQSLSNLCCNNKKCQDYGKRKGKNLVVCGWHGINNHLRLLYCRTCKTRFSEIKSEKSSRIKSDKGIIGIYQNTI
ncbi:MAG: hypothetical protein JXA96_01815 [Sedimentisphaerales bacterium]|nr:hypothetical protein [Sedimentisphaerales bacterium]